MFCVRYVARGSSAEYCTLAVNRVLKPRYREHSQVAGRDYRVNEERFGQWLVVATNDPSKNMNICKRQRHEAAGTQLRIRKRVHEATLAVEVWHHEETENACSSKPTTTVYPSVRMSTTKSGA